MATVARGYAVAGSAAFEFGKSRLGPIIGLPRLLEELGVSPAQAFRAAGIRRSLFDDPENRISLDALCRLLSVCETLTGRPDFGLLLGARFTLADFGTLGVIMSNSASLAEAVRMLMLHFHFYDRAAIPVFLRSESEHVFLGYSLCHPATANTAQLQDTAMVVAYRMLRELCGSAWQPLFVQFSHHRPGGSVASYRRVFGSGLRFDAVLCGLSFAASWLEQPIAGADPARSRSLNKALQKMEACWPVSVAEEVQCILHQLLPGGSVTSTTVAQLFGCSERTLRQKLRSEGTSMQYLLANTRFELARHLLQSTELPMSQIAAALCYADSAVFSRAFNGWAGMSPRQWRRDLGER
jgi:AraC-like DNA-binding protein